MVRVEVTGLGETPRYNLSLLSESLVMSTVQVSQKYVLNSYSGSYKQQQCESDSRADHILSISWKNIELKIIAGFSLSP